LAAGNAIISVEWAMEQVKMDADEKMREIDSLKQHNASLESRVRVIIYSRYSIIQY